MRKTVLILMNINSDGREIVTGGDDGWIYVADIESGAVLHRVKGHSGKSAFYFLLISFHIIK